ncbi:MAG: chemotaxis-specific protein-glutamate methyltransferase CheB [Acidobacteriota bacterium]
MIRAIVIDDSAFNRVTISRLLESSGEVKVVATAADGESGIKQTLRHTPDVITLDIEMPGIDGFGFLRWLMANQPTPVIAVSSRADAQSVFKALELGAAEFIVKPGGPISPRLEEVREDLLAKVRAAHDVRLDNLAARMQASGLPLAPQAESGLKLLVDVVVIGASTGGPPALQTLFQRTPRINVPFVVAQHMPAVFTRLFAERVDRISSYTVKEGVDGERLRAATVYVAPGGMQTEVRRDGAGLMLDIYEPAEGDLYAPSVDRLFESASRACAERVLAIILTGMGADGAEAIRTVRGRGGKTIAESAETAIIFGMPRGAIGTGAVQHVLPLHEITAAINRLCHEE